MPALSENRLQMLRLAYGGLHSIPHQSDAHRRLIDMIQRMPEDQQSQIEQAGIRWLSPVAFNVRRGAPDAPLPGHEQHVRDQGRGYPPKKKAS